jgi:hypothetical protein
LRCINDLISKTKKRRDAYHLVLKVLSSDERVQKILGTSALDGLNLTTGTSDVRVEIKDLPELVD